MRMERKRKKANVFVPVIITLSSGIFWDFGLDGGDICGAPLGEAKLVHGAPGLRCVCES